MKRTVFLVLLIGAFHSINAQTESKIEIKNDSIKITTSSNGKAYYNNKEIAIKDSLDLTNSSEVSTGEKFNGKRVYAKTLKYTLSSSLLVGATRDLDAQLMTSSTITDVWIDTSNSFYKNLGLTYNINHPKGISALIVSPSAGIRITNNGVDAIGSGVIIYIRMKYVR